MASRMHTSAAKRRKLVAEISLFLGLWPAWRQVCPGQQRRAPSDPVAALDELRQLAERHLDGATAASVGNSREAALVEPLGE